MKRHPSVTVNHRELAVTHIFRLGEICKYLGVIGDAEQPWVLKNSIFLKTAKIWGMENV
jgi:hypothetical protein